MIRQTDLNQYNNTPPQQPKTKTENFNAQELAKFTENKEQDLDGLMINPERTAALIINENSEPAKALTSQTEPIEYYKDLFFNKLYQYIKTTKNIPNYHVKIGNGTYDLHLIIKALKIIGNKDITIFQRSVAQYPLILRNGKDAKFTIAPIWQNEANTYPTLTQILTDQYEKETPTLETQA